MAIKVCMYPKTSELGIGRVVEAYQRHLPAFGIEFVDNENQADVVVVHAGSQSKRQPDVCHCHGLYPTATLDKSDAYFSGNAQVLENVRTARVVTVPSEWVADLFRRDMLLDPIVLPHGVDADAWPKVSRNGNGSYVLWAKGHTPGVCDPKVLSNLAAAMPSQRFVTTYGDAKSNVSVTGKLPFDRMRSVLSQAEVYLAVTKETFGIQTLEAMACGVPVLGYNWGGTADIVTHGHDGYLVEPGDIDGLVAGLEWLKVHGDVVSVNAIESAKLYSWEVTCRYLAKIYKDCANDNPEPTVSVVIPCYNYANAVSRAIESVLAQDYDGEFEIIVVNDGSTDNTSEILAAYVDRVTIVEQANNGVAAARNVGISYAKGEFVACLDADDMMLPHFLSDLVPALREDRGLGISYGKLMMTGEDGRERESGWPPEFCYKRQVLGHNQVPSACVFRKEAWRRAGGYKSQYTPAEDAELWLRITSIGYDAVRAVDRPVYRYQVHKGSLSRTLKNVKYEDDKPWAQHPLFGAPACDYEHDSYPVRNYDDPWVSVIIPVGTGHEDIAWRAVDSVLLQSMPHWEVIVINDSGQPLIHTGSRQPLKDAYPFVLQEDVDYRNVSKARNRGAELAKADLLVFLDADDSLVKGFLSQTIQAYNDNPDYYIYTDWLSWDGTNEKHGARDFDCEGLKLQALHPVTTLIPKAWHNEVKGFDEELGIKGWEDWDYYLKMVLIAQHCGYRVPEPLVRYDLSTGVRREGCLNDKDKLVPIIKGRYFDIMCIGCGRKSKSAAPRGKQAAPVQAPAPARARVPAGSPFSHPMGRLAAPANQTVAADDGLVEVVENSGNRGKHPVVGAATKKKYGNKCHGQRFRMDPSDQAAQPHLYVRTSVVQTATAVPAMPAKPTPPESVSRPTAPPAPKLEPEEAEPYDAEQDGIDVTLLKLSQIKVLGLEGEDAAIAWEQEMDGKQRKTVLAYLEGQAGDDWFEEVDEEEE